MIVFEFSLEEKVIDIGKGRRELFTLHTTHSWLIPCGLDEYHTHTNNHLSIGLYFILKHCENNNRLPLGRPVQIHVLDLYICIGQV